MNENKQAYLAAIDEVRAERDAALARAEKAEVALIRSPSVRLAAEVEAERDALREQLQEARKIVERLVAYNAGAPWPDRRDAQRFLGDSEATEESE